MSDVKRWSSFVLMIIAILTLMATYGYIDLTKIAVSYMGVSTDSSIVKNDQLWIILKISVVLGLVLAHISCHINEFRSHFDHGFRYSTQLQSELKDYLREKIGHDKFPAPVGNIAPTLFPKKSGLGAYQKSDGTYTENLYYRAGLAVYFCALIHGISKAIVKCRIVLWFPLILGMWALVA